MTDSGLSNENQDFVPEPRQFYQSPWTYVPVLYFLQALPVSLVQDVSSIIYKDFGIDNEAITRWTALIALPWALQMLFGPLVDLNGTKRQWLLYGQLIIAGLFGLAAFAIQLPNAFAISLVIFFVIAIVSTLANIATDGFYLLALPKERQAKFAGIQTTCYRLGTLFCKGFLVAVAGHFGKSLGVNKSWMVALIIAAIIFFLGWFESRFAVPKPVQDVLKSGNTIEERKKTIAQTTAILIFGLAGYFAASAIIRISAFGIWRLFDGTKNGPLRGWILANDPKIIGFPVGHSGILAEIGQLVVCIGFLTIAYQFAQRKIVGSEMGYVFSNYFKQKGIVAILCFLMFYRFGEAMVSKMAPLFLKDNVSVGGLGFSNTQIASIVGTSGVLGIVFGGLLGGWVVGQFGLKRSFWTIAILMHLPNLLYLWSSYAHPSLLWMNLVAFVDQFGYGFGFAGYFIFQMSVARRGSYPTSHYALGVGIGALFISVAGVLSGILQANLGYHGFFIAVIFLTVPGLISLLFIPLDEEAKPTITVTS